MKALINDKTVQIVFRYDDASNAYFKTWKDMIDFWTPYYDSRADAERHLKRFAFGCAVTEQGLLPICHADVPGPLCAAEKQALVKRGAENANGMWTLENV